ncbi:MAG TPA: hypothetical protein VD789_06155 [Thermomicrobiales bacterium]|nr:hypothetical protein [Thermomicrobiales bacterium]
MLIQPEFAQIMVNAHQDYLRSLAVEHNRIRETPRRTRRQAAGSLLVRFGRWLEGHRPEIQLEMPVTAGVSADR